MKLPIYGNMQIVKLVDARITNNQGYLTDCYVVSRALTPVMAEYA